MLSYADHAAEARAAVRRLGLHDCIHYAEDWRRRVDTLYALANASGIKWWENGGGSPGMLADGRMAVMGTGVTFVELPAGRKAPPPSEADPRLSSVDCREVR